MEAINEMIAWLEQRIKFHQDSIRNFRKYGRGMAKDIFISKGQIMEDEIIMERLFDITCKEKKTDLTTEAIETMSLAEMKLQHITEESNFNRNQLDTTSIKLNQVMAIIDNHIQNLDDTFVKTHDPKTKETAYRVVQAMRNIRDDIEKAIKEE